MYIGLVLLFVLLGPVLIHIGNRKSSAGIKNSGKVILVAAIVYLIWTVYSLMNVAG